MTDSPTSPNPRRRGQPRRPTSPTRSASPDDVLDEAAGDLDKVRSSTVDAGAYDSDSITVLEGLEAVRKRPGMYIGSTGERGLHHLVHEVVDNAVDEALAGYCDTILVRILPDGGIQVIDNGRGIPVKEHPKEKIPAVTLALTVLHAGGKFGDGGYKVSGGLHGVGVSVVNALSEPPQRRGASATATAGARTSPSACPTAPLEQLEATDETGTTVTFYASPDIFETTTYSYDTLAARLPGDGLPEQGPDHHHHRRAARPGGRGRQRRSPTPSATTTA